jgi:hypothetical protein
VKVLEDQQERLHLGLAQQKAPYRVQRPLAALGWIESLPLGVIALGIQQRKQCRERALQGTVEAQDLAGQLVSDLLRAVVIDDAEMGLEELDDR